MIVNDLHFLAELPRTKSGKIDRLKLTRDARRFSMARILAWTARHRCLNGVLNSMETAKKESYE
jgi:hypothetical protein